MKPLGAEFAAHLHIAEPKLGNEASHMPRILGAKCAPTDVRQYVAEQPHLMEEQKAKLLKILLCYEGLFDGTLGEWKGKLCHIQLREGATPYHGRPYSMPKAYERTLKMELEQLRRIGALKKANRPE